MAEIQLARWDIWTLIQQKWVWFSMSTSACGIETKRPVSWSHQMVVSQGNPGNVQKRLVKG